MLSLYAICCVAPLVRFNAFAIFAVGVRLRASAFNSRISSLVQARRLVFLATGCPFHLVNTLIDWNLMPQENFWSATINWGGDGVGGAMLLGFAQA